MSFRANCRRFSPIAALLAVALLAAVPAVAADHTCLQDEYSKVNSQNLVCTANDVKVAKAFHTTDLGGTTLAQCQPNQTISFIADFIVQTSSNKTRSNIGLYFGTPQAQQTETQSGALLGTCSDNIIRPVVSDCSAATGALPGDVQCGSSHADELDTSQFPAETTTTGCGDTSSTDPLVCLAPDPNSTTGNQISVTPNQNGTCPAGSTAFPGSQIVRVEIDNFVCPNTPGQNVTLADCTSWQVPGKAIQCTTGPLYYPYPFDTNGNPEAIPGSPSKCNCDTVTLPIIVQSPSVTVTKRCTTGFTTGSDNTLCYLSDPTKPNDAGTNESGPVTYTVNITNTSNFGSVVIDQICDNQYGNIFTVSGYSGSACGAGSQCTASLCTGSGTPFGYCTGLGSGTAGAGSSCITSTTCSSSSVGSPACTFLVNHPEETTVTDTVSVKGHGDSDGPFGPSSSNSVTVTSFEAATAGLITKSPQTTVAACATVRYQAEVKNTSASGTDETLNLSQLFDDNVNLNTTSSSILATTCDQSTTGACNTTTHKCTAGFVGLSCNANADCNVSSGGGALPKTLAVNESYTCQFDAQFCGTPAVIAGTCDTAAHKCTAGYIGQSCTTDNDCTTCSGIQHTDTVTATLKDDENVDVSVTGGSATVTECITQH